MKNLREKIDAPDSHQPIVQELIQRNADLFAEKDTDLGRTDTIKMSIDTSDHPPIKLEPYRTPFAKRKIVNKAIDDMLEANIICPSRSLWSFPIVVVDKKNGSKRFCTDFRKLNNITKQLSWPLPVIDDMLTSLGEAKYFTTLDLKNGYWQIPLDDQDKEKTAFSCHRGLYEYNVMPFGFAKCPRIFSRAYVNSLT